MHGDRISIGGWLSAADRRAVTSRLQDALGTGAAIGSLGDPASDAVRAANDRALSALRAVGTAGVTPTALVDAMNMAVINFPSGSAAIPPDGMEIIRTSAEAMKRAPAGSMIEIRGHTDNTGDPAANLALSEARAEAVRDALVVSGVPPSMLRASGYGDTKPRASNATEYGRFQNRRIEYALVTADKAVEATGK
jgi:OOP family OmpA-OmpF porin